MVANLYLLLLLKFLIMSKAFLIKLLFFFILFINIISCKNREAVKKNKELNKIDSIKTKEQKDIRNIGEILLPEAKKKVENWKEYQQLDELLTNFYSISPSEALDLSQELSTITQQLKDSVKIDRFKENDIGIRINVLNNMALRLYDMSTIKAIKPEEVNDEIENILNAFSSLNAKINNITNQEKLETELKTIENK